MEISNLLGLPAHPLLVHTPVVLIPVTLLLALAAVAWAPGRRALSVAVFATATVSMPGAQLAVMSGEALEERVDETALIEQHAELGEMTRTIAIVVFLAALAFVLRVWADRLPGAIGAVGRRLQAPAVGIAVMAVLLVSSVLCTVWVARAGHAGAKATWNDLPASAPHDGGGENGD